MCTWLSCVLCFAVGYRQSLQWGHNDHGGVSNYQPHDCLLNRLFRRRSKKTSKLRVTGLCAGNSPGPVNSPHKGPVTRKMLPFDDVIMFTLMRRYCFIDNCTFITIAPVPTNQPWKIRSCEFMMDCKDNYKKESYRRHCVYTMTYMTYMTYTSLKTKGYHATNVFPTGAQANWSL